MERTMDSDSAGILGVAIVVLSVGVIVGYTEGKRDARQDAQQATKSWLLDRKKTLEPAVAPIICPQCRREMDLEYLHKVAEEDGTAWIAYSPDGSATVACKALDPALVRSITLAIEDRGSIGITPSTYRLLRASSEVWPGPSQSASGPVTSSLEGATSYISLPLAGSGSQ